MPDELKRCSRCKQDLPLDAFQRRLTPTYTDNGTLHDPPGPQTYCRACNTDYCRERRARMRQARQLRRAQDAQTRSNPPSQTTDYAT